MANILPDWPGLSLDCPIFADSAPTNPPLPPPLSLPHP